MITDRTENLRLKENVTDYWHLPNIYWNCSIDCYMNQLKNWRQSKEKSATWWGFFLSFFSFLFSYFDWRFHRNGGSTCITSMFGSTYHKKCLFSKLISQVGESIICFDIQNGGAVLKRRRFIGTQRVGYGGGGGGSGGDAPDARGRRSYGYPWRCCGDPGWVGLSADVLGVG